MINNASKIQPQAIFDTLENLADNLHYNERPALDYINSAAVPAASNDYEQALAFLYSYRGSRDTFAAYRREVERLLQWCWFVKSCSLTQIKRADIEAYIDFCQQPPVNWIATKTVPRFINHQGLRIANAEWRPFVVKKSHYNTASKAEDFSLSLKALQAAFAILGSFFTYLMQEEYTESNPVAFCV